MSSNAFKLMALRDTYACGTPSGRLRHFYPVGEDGFLGDWCDGKYERNLIRERTMAGLAAARERGRTGGRPKQLDES